MYVICSEELEFWVSNKTNVIICSLKARQQQWKEEEAIRIANTPDPSVPPGHTLMPREERLQTLASLEKSKLYKFPYYCIVFKDSYVQLQVLNNRT